MKAQMEIMGLAIIIVLVGLGVFFAIALYEPPTTDTGAYVQNAFSTNFVLAVLQTNVEGGGGTIEDTVRACAKSSTRDCTVLKNALDTIANGTEDTPGMLAPYNYRWEVRVDEKILYRSQNDCGPGRERSLAGFQPIPIFAGAGSKQAIMEFSLCE